MTALNNALAAIDAATANTDDAGQLLVRAKVRGLMRGYDARWKDAGYVPVAVETYVEADLPNVDTDRKSRTWKIGGVIDVLCNYNGRRVLIDAKTTSNSIEDPNAPYWRQLVVESQPTHYMLLEWLHGRKVDTAIWDVVKKPGIRPKKLTKAERGLAVANRKYFGDELLMHELDRLQTEDNESLSMYESRLAHECTIEKPSYYFQRRGVPRLDNEIVDYARQLWEIGLDMLATRNNGRHYRNSGACIRFNSPCQFLGICSGHDSTDSDKWTRKEFVHNELPRTGDGDGHDILTNSRIRSYQTCKRLHELQYEQGIERLDDDEREALYMGSLWHLGLAAWWKSFMGEDHVNSQQNGCAVSEEAQPTDPAPNVAGGSYW